MVLPPENLPPVHIVDIRQYESNRSKKIYDLWSRSRGEKFAPDLGKDFQIDDLDLAAVPCITIVDVIEGGADYYYRFWGTRNVEIKGMEMTGKLMSEGPLPQVIKYGHQQFIEVIQRRKPTAFVYVGPYRSPIQRQQTTFRFPLSSDGVTVDGIMSYQDLDHQELNWSTKFDGFWEGNKPNLKLK